MEERGVVFEAGRARRRGGSLVGGEPELKVASRLRAHWFTVTMLVAWVVISTTLGALVWTALTYTTPHEEVFTTWDETLSVGFHLRTDGPFSAGQPAHLGSVFLRYNRSMGIVTGIGISLWEFSPSPWTFGTNQTLNTTQATGGRGYQVAVFGASATLRIPETLVSVPSVSLVLENESGANVFHQRDFNRTTEFPASSPEDSAAYFARRNAALLAVVGGVWGFVPAGLKGLVDVVPLTAMALGNVDSGSGPLSVKLKATALGGIRPYAYRWEFGDDSGAGEGQAVEH